MASGMGEAAGGIVCYLSDDDLATPDHVAEMCRLLEGADFSHSPHFFVGLDGRPTVIPIALDRPTYQAHLMRNVWNAIGLTGAAHTLEAYRRLPVGWSPAPPGIATDLHMWQQFLRLPGFRGVSGRRLTALTFPDPIWSREPLDLRVDALRRWSEILLGPGLEAWRSEAEADGWWAAALERGEDVVRLQVALRAIVGTRTWRVRERVVRVAALRRLLARRPHDH
jgi:hypothetical protein